MIGMSVHPTLIEQFMQLRGKFEACKARPNMLGHVLQHVKHQTGSSASNQRDRWRWPRKDKSPLIDEAAKSGYMMLVAVSVAHTAQCHGGRERGKIMPTHDAAKLSTTEKVGYSLADGAAQFVFLTMVNYQAGFYTDAMGISAADASWLVLIARLWDAFFDPMMGFLADRTRTRWGRFRPWILWSIVPWAVCMVLAYTVPPLRSYWATYVYALVTNIALMTVYSMNNTPYSALMAVMTGNQKERTNLSQYRFIAAMMGQLIVGGFTLVIMNSLGGPLPLPPTELAKTQLAAMTRSGCTVGQNIAFQRRARGCGKTARPANARRYAGHDRIPSAKEGAR